MDINETYRMMQAIDKLLIVASWILTCHQINHGDKDIDNAEFNSFINDLFTVKAKADELSQKLSQKIFKDSVSDKTK